MKEKKRKKREDERQRERESRVFHSSPLRERVENAEKRL